MKTRIIICLASFLACTTNAMEEKQWPAIFEQYKDLVDAVPLVKKQYKAHIHNKIPTPHDDRIVAIPIQECNESIIDIDELDLIDPHADEKPLTAEENSNNISTFHNAYDGCILNVNDLTDHRGTRVYMMPNPSYPAEGPTYNSGLPGNSKMRKGVGKGLLLMVEELDTIAPRFGYESKQIDIQVCDALRNKDVESFLFNLLVLQKMSENPNIPRENIEQEISKVACPPKKPYYHPSGSSVDIRLWNAKNNEFLDMGDFGVPWTKDHSTFLTYTEKITEQQKKNRLLCVLAAAKAGLVNYPGEFWHYSFGDSMAARWTKRKAIYDLVEQPSLEISMDENGHFKVQEKK